MSSLATLRAGPADQTSPLGVAVWREREELSRRGRRIVAQWIPSHCGVEGNERADAVARDAAECSSGLQDNLPSSGQVGPREDHQKLAARMVPVPDRRSPAPVGHRPRSVEGDRRPPASGGALVRRPVLPAQDRAPPDCGVPGLLQARVPGHTVPPMSGGARPPGPPAAEMSGAEVNPDATDPHHTSRTGGGTRKRCGGGPGGRRQIRPEPRGYAALTRGPHPRWRVVGGTPTTTTTTVIHCQFIQSEATVC